MPVPSRRFASLAEPGTSRTRVAYHVFLTVAALNAGLWFFALVTDEDLHTSPDAAPHSPSSCVLRLSRSSGADLGHGVERADFPRFFEGRRMCVGHFLNYRPFPAISSVRRLARLSAWHQSAATGRGADASAVGCRPSSASCMLGRKNELSEPCTPKQRYAHWRTRPSARPSPRQAGFDLRTHRIHTPDLYHP